MNFIEAMKACDAGLAEWKSKPHNAKWWKRIDGTPIPNDLLVCIAQQVMAAPAEPRAGTVQFSLNQALELVKFFGSENCDVTVGPHEDGLFAYCTDYPEEGGASLGRFDPDEEIPAEPRAAEGAGKVKCAQCGDTGRVTDTNGVTWPCAWCDVNKKPTAAAAVPAGGDAVATVCGWKFARRVRDKAIVVTAPNGDTVAAKPVSVYLYENILHEFGNAALATPAPRGGVTVDVVRKQLDEAAMIAATQLESDVARRFMAEWQKGLARLTALSTPPAAQAQDAGPRARHWREAACAWLSEDIPASQQSDRAIGDWIEQRARALAAKEAK